jgi:hypothetical protein
MSNWYGAVVFARTLQVAGAFSLHLALYYIEVFNRMDSFGHLAQMLVASVTRIMIR